MTETTNLDPAAETAPDGSLLTDRRRPGRVENVNPSLVPLLRGQATSGEPDSKTQFGDPDQLGATRGIALGVVLSLPLWTGILLLGRWALF